MRNATAITSFNVNGATIGAQGGLTSDKKGNYAK